MRAEFRIYVGGVAYGFLRSCIYVVWICGRSLGNAGGVMETWAELFMRARMYIYVLLHPPPPKINK